MRTTGVRIASRHLGRRLAKDGSAWAGEAVEVTGGARAAYHARLRHNLRECRSGHPEVILVLKDTFTLSFFRIRQCPGFEGVL